MDQDSLESLEWQSLLEQYSAHCMSAPAKAAAVLLEMPEEIAESQHKVELTGEAFHALESQNFSFLSALEILEPTLDRLKKSVTLDGKELLHLAKLAQISAELGKIFTSKDLVAKCTQLNKIAALIPDLTKPTAPISYAIDTDGTVKDSASPLLKSLREQERKLHSEAREKLDHILQQAFREGHLQDKYFDFRDGRYLIPVKSEFKNRINGFAVENSSSNATIFMEPAAVRDCNDRIKQTRLLIEDEIYRILVELSAKIHPFFAEFFQAYIHTVEIDLSLGRGSLARQFSSIRGVSKPEFDDHFHLEELYHPLLAFILKPQQIIRNSFVLGPQKRVLVISGPNTGGKTILLKAVGLCALMARAGFYLPCAGVARVPYFQSVLAQIGDSQSLELSLSSFSGSVLNLKNILEQSQGMSLVLIDEILHATDPDEATALSRAILGDLKSRGAYSIVTTHLNGLKVAGETGFESASMEFDPEQMQPTYRLRMGIPGSSRALEIAQKLGLPRNLIELARSFLSKDRVKEQSALDDLEKKERSLEEMREQVAKMQQELNHERKNLEFLQNQLATVKKNFRAETSEKLKNLQQETMREVERIILIYKSKIKNVEEKHQNTVESKKDMESIRDKFKAIESTLEEAVPTSTILAEEEKQESEATLEKNAPVFVNSMKSDGILLSDPSQKGKLAEVMIGTMRMKVPWEQLQPKHRERPIARGRYQQIALASDCPTELHILGKTASDAMDALENYLDRAARSERAFVRIVHGHGNGILRKAVRDYLKSCRYDIKWRAGTPQEGGEGCTVVEFT